MTRLFLFFSDLYFNSFSDVIILIYRMLMPKKNRVAIYEYLFKEGVMVAKKDFHAPKHPELEAIPNLQVIKAMQVRALKLHIFNRLALLCTVYMKALPTNEVLKSLPSFKVKV